MLTPEERSALIERITMEAFENAEAEKATVLRDSPEYKQIVWSTVMFLLDECRGRNYADWSPKRITLKEANRIKAGVRRNLGAEWGK